MASLIQENTGKYRLFWRCHFMKIGRSIRLGVTNKRLAEQAKGMLESLVETSRLGQPPVASVAHWLDNLSPSLYEKFADAGLVEPKKTLHLKEFCDEVFERAKMILNPSSFPSYDLAIRAACEYWGAKKNIADITTGDAVDWNRWLRTSKKHTVATANKRCATMKAIFNDGKRHGVLQKNPFVDKAVPTFSPAAAEERFYFVKPEEAQRILAELEEPEMKALYAFARYAGTRHVEPYDMTWDCVRSATADHPAFVLIPCNKTKAKTGKAFRKCPLFPELEVVLRALKAKAPKGEKYLFPKYKALAKQASTKKLQEAVQRAGVPITVDIWKNQRRTRATEVAERFPSFACAEWLGHSEFVANAHYRRSSSALLEKACSFVSGQPLERAEDPGGLHEAGPVPSGRGPNS